MRKPSLSSTRLRKYLIMQNDSASTDKLQNLSSSVNDLAKYVAERRRNVFVFGRNPEAEFLISRQLARALIDDRHVGELYMGVAVQPLSILSATDIIVNCSTSVSPIDVGQFLKNRTIAQIIHYSDLCKFDEELFEVPSFVADFRLEHDNNLDFYKTFSSKLNDFESQETFKKFVNYRYNFELSAMIDYKVRVDQQYFEDFIDLEGCSIVDGGGFDGDTSEEIARRFPKFGRIHFFEPSPTNLARAKQRLQHLERVTFYNCALSDSFGTLGFDPDAGSASHVTSNTDNVIEVPCRRLDDVIDGPIDFIKLDLEGWELKALQGGELIIVRDRPYCAVAIYHAAADLREVVTWFTSVYGADRVKFYLRHYTQGWSETILYCVPV